MGVLLEMSFLNPDIIYFDSSYRQNVPDTVVGFLRSLIGLTVIDIEGNDSSRCRVITTLIHGNEPSGFIACHRWLKDKVMPETNVRFILCNPEAAKTKPFFTNRYVEHSEDLNRFFSREATDQSAVANRAQQILSLVREVNPEAIIDLHNTSGKSPAFSVSVVEDKQHLKLIELFTSTLIYTELKVGAIMEQCFDAPIVTIECGGANDNPSHRVAEKGLYRYTSKKDLFDNRNPTVQVYRHPLRIELKDDSSVGFAQHRLATTDITLRADIEELNRDITPEGEFLGWCDINDLEHFKAIDEHGINQIENILVNRDGCLFALVDLQLFMVTTVPEIATKDCLFYSTFAE
ncbi:MAG: hypothetical protein ACI9IA_001364 [Enterobacterales bacterium]|jgi:hypothetical protein